MGETGPLGASGPAAFDDVKPEDGFYNDVAQASAAGLMIGYGNGLFGPDDTVTRAQAAQILWNLEGHPAAAAEIPFEDVAADAWYAPAARWAAEKVISEGYITEEGARAFKPDDPVTHEQFAVLLYRYAQAHGKGFSGLWSFKLGYTDAADISDWALEAVSWFAMQGGEAGMQGAFAPQAACTRAEIAGMLCRYAVMQ